jgi:hypothetical protein
MATASPSTSGYALPKRELQFNLSTETAKSPRYQLQNIEKVLPAPVVELELS